MTSKLEQLKQFTTVVADTGDVEAIARLKPVDATTNPSLILKAASQPEYAALIERAVSLAKTEATPEARRRRALTETAVAFGAEILTHIPGLISTEVDARLSFERNATLQRAQRLISLYEEAGVSRERVLIKIAATWEGISAARELAVEDEAFACSPVSPAMIAVWQSRQMTSA